MTDDSENTREQGIEFGRLAEELEAESYPLSHEELLDRYGDYELVLVNGRTTVSEVLEPENQAEYDDAESVRQAIFSMVGDTAVGRKNYSDRGGTSVENDSREEGDTI